MNLRLFIGVKVDHKAAQLIDSMCHDIPLKLKWVPKENYHITLKFLGNQPQTIVVDIKKALEKAVENEEIFSYKLEKLGVFPSKSRPRVFWVGVGNGSNELIRIQEKIDIELTKIGFEREKRSFHPHLTIARIKKPISLDEFLESRKEIEWSGIDNLVESVILYESALSPQGAKYSIKEEIKIE